jgi:hypothetical protein
MTPLIASTRLLCLGALAVLAWGCSGDTPVVATPATQEDAPPPDAHGTYEPGASEPPVPDVATSGDLPPQLVRLIALPEQYELVHSISAPPGNGFQGGFSAAITTPGDPHEVYELLLAGFETFDYTELGAGAEDGDGHVVGQALYEAPDGVNVSFNVVDTDPVEVSYLVTGLAE